MICGRIQLGGTTQPNSPSHHVRHLQTREDDAERGRFSLFVVQPQFYLFWGGDLPFNPQLEGGDAQQTLLPFPPTIATEGHRFTPTQRKEGL